MATLHFDGNLKRVYEVPDASTFIVDGSGYRIYTPIDIPSAETDVRIPYSEFWSRWVDYHDDNKWALLAYAKNGGAFRFTDSNDVDIYATYDLRLINGWEVVPANYPHKLYIIGNFFGDAVTDADFDTTRITSNGVSPRILLADSLQTAFIEGEAGGDITVRCSANLIVDIIPRKLNVSANQSKVVANIRKNLSVVSHTPERVVGNRRTLVVNSG